MFKTLLKSTLQIAVIDMGIRRETVRNVISRFRNPGFFKWDTPPKFNLEPENDGVQNDFLFPGGDFHVNHV